MSQILLVDDAALKAESSEKLVFNEGVLKVMRQKKIEIELKKQYYVGWRERGCIIG